MSSHFDSVVRDRIRHSLLSAMDREQWTVVSGGELETFESRAAEVFGTKHAVATNCGTNALLAAASAIGLTSGSRVLIPAYGFYGMIAPFLFLGVRPIFVPYDLGTLCSAEEHYECGWREKPDAMVVFHPWGNVGPAARLARWAKARGIPIIADLSHCHGAFDEGRRVGEYSTIAAASFGRGKLISGGELGVCLTDNSSLANLVVAFGHPNRKRGRVHWEGAEAGSVDYSFGPKLRPHGLALAMALPQFDGYDARFAHRGAVAAEMERIAVEEDAGQPIAKYPTSTRAYWRVVLACRKRPDREAIHRLAVLGWRPDGAGYSTLLSDHPICDLPGTQSAIRCIDIVWLTEAREQLHRLLHFDVRPEDPSWRLSWRAAMKHLRDATR